MRKPMKPPSSRTVARDRVAAVPAIDPEPTAANRRLRQVRVLALALRTAARRWADAHGVGACSSPFCTCVEFERCGLIEAQLGGSPPPGGRPTPWNPSSSGEFYPTGQRERHQRAFDSPANRPLNLLCNLLAAADRVATWSLEEHGPDCRCDFCAASPAHRATARHDLAGVAWSAEQAAASVDGLSYRFLDLDAPTLGGDLRALAALADEVDPPDTNAEAAADEPMSVVG